LAAAAARAVTVDGQQIAVKLGILPDGAGLAPQCVFGDRRFADTDRRGVGEDGAVRTSATRSRVTAYFARSG